MNNKEFIQKLKAVDGKKTVYMWGTFGAQVTDSLIAGKARQYPSWYTATKVRALKALVGKGYYAFDCIGLIKGLIWGWDGSTRTSNGGAEYNSNGMPDTSANGYITKCNNVSSNFSKIEAGEVVWMTGHIGVYIGGGEVIEATPAWENGVQTTKLTARKWLKHGRIPQITYVEDVPEVIAIKKTLENLNLRAGAGTNHSIILTIPKNSDVQIYSTSNGWAKVSYKGSTGYVSEEYLKSASVGVTGTVTASSLNVRSGAGTGYRVIGSKDRGDKVEILESLSGWYKIRYGTATGFVSKDFIDSMNTPTAPVVPKLKKGRVTADSLHIRKTPGGTSVGEYTKGEVVVILGISGSWYKTDKGYSSSKYIVLI